MPTTPLEALRGHETRWCRRANHYCRRRRVRRAFAVVSRLGDGVLWWILSAAASGFGMALLYPILSAAVADISHPTWRGSAMGIYRFWRDLGYGIGALGLGMAAHFSGQMETAFWFVALSMFASDSLLLLWGEETHPRLNPASEDASRLRGPR